MGKIGGMDLKAGEGSSWVWFVERYSQGMGGFSKNCQFVVGLGNRVRFWQGGWYGDQPFQLAIPRLYGISIDKEVSVEASLLR